MEKNPDIVYSICPFHDDKHPSLIFNKKTGIWSCLACDRKGKIEELLIKYFELVLLKIEQKQ